MSKHHLLGPSSAPRWSECVGSLFGPVPEDDSNKYAREGTACHALLEECLKFGWDPKDLLGQTTGDSEFPVDLEMVDAVNLFVDTIQSVCAETGLSNALIMSEERLVHPAIPPITDPAFTAAYPAELFGGTCDCSVAGDDVLIVADLKYGRKEVYADSLQLTCYSLLKMAQLGRPVNRIIQLIIQPRGDTRVSRHEPGFEEMERAWDIIANKAKYVSDNIGLILVGPPVGSLKAGGWCHHCKRRMTCVALNTMMQEVVLDGVTQEPDKPLAAAPTRELTTEDLVLWLDRTDAITQFLGDVKKALYVRASQGQEIPGRKLTASWGNRKWSADDDTMFAALPGVTGLTVEELRKTSLHTPAQVEKLLKERGILKDVQDNLDALMAVNKPTGVKLVSVKARGEAVRPETAIEFLKTLEESLSE